MSDFDDKLAAAAARVAVAPKEKKRGRCLELMHTVVWGHEGAKHLDLKIAIITGFEVLFLGLVLLDAFLGGALKKHGIHPRDFPLGFLGIFTAPFLHKGLTHFLLNMVPFAVLGMLVMLRRRGIATFFTLSGTTALVSGMLVWSIGSHKSNHIGSSGLIFAYFGFLVVGGAVRRNFRDFLVAIVVFLSYSSLFWGVLPIDDKVSWESHLFGLICGCLYAFVDTGLKEEAPAEGGEEEKDEERESLLP